MLTRLAEHHWILIVLVVLGALMTLLAPLAPMREARRLRARLDGMRHAQVMTDFEDMRVQAERFSSFVPSLDGLVQRSRGALTSIGESAKILRLPEAAAALRIVFATLRALGGLHR